MANVFNLIKKIQRESKDVPDYNTGLVGEKLIVSSYKSMTIDKLEKMRYIINKIIKDKKVYNKK